MRHVSERIFNEAEQAAAEGEATEDVEAAAVADTGLPDAEKPEPKKRGRKPLPKDLPRERVEHDLAEDQKACPCWRNRMHRMGETMSEQLHIEVKATVLQHVRFKYACRHCERTALHTPIVMHRCRHSPCRAASPRHPPSRSCLPTNMSTAPPCIVWSRHWRGQTSTSAAVHWATG